SIPSALGCGKPIPSGLSPHPQHAGSWWGGIRGAGVSLTALRGRTCTTKFSPRGGRRGPSRTLSANVCRVVRAGVPKACRSPEAAALVVGAVEVLRARGRHRGRGRDLERERRGGDDL